jgi:WD40 repeat protein
MKSLVAAVFVALTALIGAHGTLAREPAGKPMIRIETGVHTSDITGLSTDASGRLLATSSYDKTLRLWSLTAKEELPTIVRAPIDFDREGALYAVALSPDGREAVTAGWTGGWDENATWSLYVFDLETGEMKKRVADLKGRAESLAYSSTGTELAVGLKQAPGVLLFNTRDWTVIGRDSDQTDDIPSIDIDRNGKVASASLSGIISLYGPGLTDKRTVVAPGGSRVAVLRFSPDGSTIAVGYEDSPRVDLLSATDLRRVGSADTRGVDGNFIALAWSPLGDFLYGAGRYERNGRHPIRRWSNHGQGPAQDSAEALATVTRLQALPDERVAFTTQGGTVGILDRTMRLTWVRRPETADFRNQASTLRASQDGTVVDFAFDRFGDTPVRFSLLTKSLSAGDPSDTTLAPAVTEAKGMEVLNWSRSANPTLNGAPLQLRPHDEALSLAIAPDAGSFLLGTSWRLIRYDSQGRVLWDLETPGETWAVDITGNGKLAIAAFSDGTIRWLRLRDGQTLLSLFSQSTTRRWVAWTSSGYYAASSGGDALIGWHVNRGRDHGADFFSVARFRDTFYRPDVVEKILATEDEDKAIIRKGENDAPDGKPHDVARLLPPVVTFGPGSKPTNFRTSHLRIAYTVRLPNGAPAKVLEVRADGRPIGSPAALSSLSTRAIQVRLGDCRRHLPWISAE